MRHSFKVCLLLVLTPVSPAIDVAPAQRGSFSAEAVAGLFLGSAPGTSVSAWKAHTPTATWQRYRGTLEQIVDEESGRRGVEPSGFWCAVATDHHGGVERVAVFFALRDTAPPACRLELVQGVALKTTDEQAATLFQELAAVMTQKLGAHDAVDLNARTTPLPYGGGTGLPEGITRWEEGVRWHDDDRDVFLFRAARAVGFSSRSPLLTRDSEDQGEPNNVAREAEQRLADALRGGFTDAAAAMAYDFVPQHQAQIRRGLTQVLDARVPGPGPKTKRC